MCVPPQLYDYVDININKVNEIDIEKDIDLIKTENNIEYVYEYQHLFNLRQYLVLVHTECGAGEVFITCH